MFKEQKLGTGAMISSAKAGELDVIIALTEGLVADIANGKVASKRAFEFESVVGVDGRHLVELMII